MLCPGRESSPRDTAGEGDSGNLAPSEKKDILGFVSRPAHSLFNRKGGKDGCKRRLKLSVEQLLGTSWYFEQYFYPPPGTLVTKYPFQFI